LVLKKLAKQLKLEDEEVTEEVEEKDYEEK
jgi:hypothetical protein